MTDPRDYPSAQPGVDQRDAEHPFFAQKPHLRVFLKPLSQKIIEKNLWVEVITLALVFVIGLGEVLGRAMGSGLYVALGIFVGLLALRFLNIESETHLKQITPVTPPEETQPPA